MKPELYKDLDDTERTIEVASQHDYVINTTLGFHPESAAALVHGLAKRKQSSGKDVFMIHTYVFLLISSCKDETNAKSCFTLSALEHRIWQIIPSQAST